MAGIFPGMLPVVPDIAPVAPGAPDIVGAFPGGVPIAPPGIPGVVDMDPGLSWATTMLLRKPSIQATTAIERIVFRIVFSLCESIHLRHLQPCRTSTCTVLILLASTATDPTRAFENPLADNRHRALAGNHMPTLRAGDAAENRALGPFL